MRQSKTTSGERIVKDIKRKTHKQYSAEEKIRILLGWSARRRKHRGVMPKGALLRALFQVGKGLHGGRKETDAHRKTPNRLQLEEHSPTIYPTNGYKFP